MSVDASSGEPPSAALGTVEYRHSRPDIAGPDEPEAPYPIRISGFVQRGFGRGGRDLGCHTGARRVRYDNDNLLVLTLEHFGCRTYFQSIAICSPIFV